MIFSFVERLGITIGVVGGLSKGGVTDESDWFGTLEARVISTAVRLIRYVLELAIRSPAEATIEVVAN